MKHYEVVAAIIIDNDEILCMQRNKGKYDYVSYKYEFPGGKIEKSETHIQALKRELQEEMSLNVTVSEDDFFLTVEHQYPDFSLKMHSYICHVTNRQFVRKEHINHVWLNSKDLNKLDWAAADIPIVQKIMGGTI